MRTLISGMAILVAMSGVAFAQSKSAPPAFEEFETNYKLRGVMSVRYRMFIETMFGKPETDCKINGPEWDTAMDRVAGRDLVDPTKIDPPAGEWADQSLDIAELIGPLIAGLPLSKQGGVVAGLTALYLANYPADVRSRAFDAHIELVNDLMKAHIELVSDLRGPFHRAGV